MVRQIFRLPLRQTRSFMNSLVTALDIGTTLPDFSSLSKRNAGLPRHKLTQELKLGSLVIVDSIGLKVYGKDEWHQEKQDIAARRTWLKMHLAVDENHQIVACEPTTPETGDPSALPDLLAQIDTPFDTIADGAYDGDPVSQAALKQQPTAQVVVPPDKTAGRQPASESRRDGRSWVIDEFGRPWGCSKLHHWVQSGSY
jgi:Transposase DDE domain